MSQEQIERFKDATKLVKMLVQSHAKEVGVSTTSVRLENGRTFDCRDRHLLTIDSDNKSDSITVQMQLLEACLDSGNWKQVSNLIVELFRRLQEQEYNES